MPRKHERVKVEPGLYQAGAYYYACATPPGSRSARFKALGQVGIMRARRLRDEFRAEVRGGRLPSRDGKLPLSDVASAWLAEQERLVALGELKQRTYDIYENAVRLHFDPLGSRSVQSITPDDLVEWHRQAAAGGAAKWTIRSWWVALRGVLGHASRHGLIVASPADKLTRRERPKRGESRQRFLSREEMGKLLTHAPSLRYRAAIATGLFAGLRISEVVGLVWEDVDFDGEQLHVRYQLGRDDHKRHKLKSDAGLRDVVMMPALAALLRKHRMASGHKAPHHPVFATRKGSALMDRNLAVRGFDKACEDAKLTDVTFHALRHTFASMLIAQGNDVVFVSRQLGHADPSTTLDIYGHLFDAARHARGAREQLEADYGGMLRGHS